MGKGLETHPHLEPRYVFFQWLIFIHLLIFTYNFSFWIMEHGYNDTSYVAQDLSMTLTALGPQVKFFFEYFLYFLLTTIQLWWQPWNHVLPSPTMMATISKPHIITLKQKNHNQGCSQWQQWQGQGEVEKEEEQGQQGIFYLFIFIILLTTIYYHKCQSWPQSSWKEPKRWNHVSSFGLQAQNTSDMSWALGIFSLFLLTNIFMF